MVCRAKLVVIMSAEGFLQTDGIASHLLTSAAAHELTSPLVLLRQLGLAISADNLSEKDRQLLGKQLALTSERALRMAWSLSMSSESQLSLPLEPINPISICQEVVHELTPLFAAHGQVITLQPRSRVPLTVANRQVLQKILLGFGDNALRYGSPRHPIHMTIASHGDRVRIGVRDWGPAVPIDLWKQLEERIAKHAPTPLGNRPQTSSVSLIVARRLAEMMDSMVGIVRHRDGATFYVDLRISEQMSLL